jgi:diguanylate cyclase (GGDEF)-like protein
VRILVSEDDPVSRRVLVATLTKWGHEVVVTGNGLEAWKALQEEDPPPLTILDWMMPGLDGLEVCRRVRRRPASSPAYIILLTAKNSKEDLVEGLEAGADDFLTKPFDRHELRVRLQVGARIVELQRHLAERVRELEEAIAERKRVEEELRNLTLTDDLTGLYNRRGFFTLAEHRLKIACRTGQSSLIIYADMDGLKQINDTLGHNEGSRAIARVADVLRQTFRESDIIARLGGDEFAILAADVSAGGVDNLTARLCENLKAHNGQGDQRYRLSLSLGTVRVDAGTDSTIEALMARADEAMYEHKRWNKARPNLEALIAGKSGGNVRHAVTLHAVVA